MRQLVLDAAVSDMRQVASSVSRSFDVVLAFDNSVAHLLDDDICAAFQQFLTVLRPGGVFLCSVRDYDKVQRGEPATHLYGRRETIYQPKLSRSALGSKIRWLDSASGMNYRHTER